MKYLFILPVICLVFINAGCSTVTYNAEYGFTLTQVERPVSAIELFGIQNIDNSIVTPKYKFCFEDSLVKVLWNIDTKEIFFALENKASYTLKIPWDDAVYIDENNYSHRVIHSSIDYVEKERPQPPSVIVRKGFLEESIIPSENIKWIEANDHATGWVVLPLLSNSVNHQLKKGEDDPVLNDFIKDVKAKMGKFIQVLLPIQIGNNKYEYIFVFRINKIVVDK